MIFQILIEGAEFLGTPIFDSKDFFETFNQNILQLINCFDYCKRNILPAH